MNNSAKYFCVSSKVSSIVEELQKRNPNKSNLVILEEFLSSKTYSLLCNLKTKYWTESPIYMIDVYNNELGNSSNK